MNLGLSLSPADCMHQCLSQKQPPPPEVPLLIPFLSGVLAVNTRLLLEQCSAAQITTTDCNKHLSCWSFLEAGRRTLFYPCCPHPLALNKPWLTRRFPSVFPGCPFPTASLEKCTAASWPQNDGKQSWQSHLLHPQLKGLIQSIHDTSVSVSLEDPGLPTVFQHL